MPIKGITDRPAAFPEIGQIRKGAPKQTKQRADGSTYETLGADLQHFRVEFDERETAAAATFTAAYGAQPNELNILFPFDDVERNFECWLEAYVAGALVYRSDGEHVLYMLNHETGERIVINGEPHTPHKANPIGFYGSKRQAINARPVGRMKVIIPELARLAYLTLHTTSLHDAMNLSRQLEALRAIHGRLAGIPLKLRRRPVEISTPSGENGKRARREKWLLSVEADPEWVAAKLGEMKRLALPGGAIAALAAPAVINAESDDDDVIEAEPIEDFSQAILEATVEHLETAPVAVNGHATTNGSRPYPPEQLRARLAQFAEHHASKPASKQQRGLFASMLEQCFAPADDAQAKRRNVQRLLFGNESATNISPDWILAGLDWLRPAKDEGGHYSPDAMAATEARRAIEQEAVNV